MSRWRERTVFQSSRLRCPEDALPQIADMPVGLPPVDGVPVGRSLGSVYRSSPSASTVSLDLQSLPRSAGDSPDPRQHPFGLGIALSARLWIPVAFRLAAFASWIILFPLRDSRSLRSRTGSRHTMPLARPHRGFHVPHR